jgi:prophage DNA circulation protein
MRPESLRLLQQAVRINPAATLRAIAQEHPKSKDDLAEAWDAVLEEIDNDPRTLAEYMETPAVRALIRAQEVANAVRS